MLADSENDEHMPDCVRSQAHLLQPVGKLVSRDVTLRDMRSVEYESDDT